MHPFLWRGIRDFGTGALGDMGCHTLDGTFWALGLNHFKSVELVDGAGIGKDANAWPKAKEDYAKPELPGGSTVRFVFGERQVDGKTMPELSLTWYEGGRKPQCPEGLKINLNSSGVLLECEKGWLVGLDDYCNNIVIYMKDADPAAKPVQEEGCKIFGNISAPAKSLKRSEGHWEEWFAAAKGDKPFDYPAANFAYAAPFTETLLAATLVEVIGGKLDYDAAAMRFTNSDLATSLLTKEYRKGWDFRMS
jgi:predicted dehydrogenase